LLFAYIYLLKYKIICVLYRNIVGLLNFKYNYLGNVAIWVYAMSVWVPLKRIFLKCYKLYSFAFICITKRSHLKLLNTDVYVWEMIESILDEKKQNKFKSYFDFITLGK